jgi:signal peptidase I
VKRLLSRSRSVDIILWPTLLAAVLLFVGFDAISVNGPSMEPELSHRQTVFVNRLAYGLRAPAGMGYIVSWKAPRPGELVVFRHPTGGDLAVKRCLLAPGDPVRVTRDRLHADGGSFRVTPPVVMQLEGRSAIPPGYVFVLGENLAASSDSRDFGLLPISEIYGRVIIPTERGVTS